MKTVHPLRKRYNKINKKKMSGHIEIDLVGPKKNSCSVVTVFYDLSVP